MEHRQFSDADGEIGLGDDGVAPIDALGLVPDQLHGDGAGKAPKRVAGSTGHVSFDP